MSDELKLLFIVNGQYAGALKYYMLAIATASDNFSRPLVKTVIEDYVYKRMIKCLTQLQCHVQVSQHLSKLSNLLCNLASGF